MKKFILILFIIALLLPTMSFGQGRYQPLSFLNWLFGDLGKKKETKKTGDKAEEVKNIQKQLERLVREAEQRLKNANTLKKDNEAKPPLKPVPVIEPPKRPDKSIVSKPAIGFEHDDNFIVSAPTPRLAKEIIDVANQARDTFYATYFPNVTIPEGEKFKISIYAYKADNEGGVTWCVDNPARRMHLCWVYSPDLDNPENLLNSVRHEVQHGLLANVIKTGSKIEQIALWAQEMFGTIVDAGGLRADYCDAVKRVFESGGFSDVRNIVNERVNSPMVHVQAFGMGLFLSAQGDESKKISLIQEYFNNGKDWEKAFRTVYGFKDLNNLQYRFNDWLKENSGSLCAIK